MHFSGLMQRTVQFLRLKQTIKNKHRGKLIKGIVLLEDNARPYVDNTILELLANFRWEVLRHPPYRPDIFPCDFHTFGTLKKSLSDQRFIYDKEVQDIVKNSVLLQSRSFYTVAASILLLGLIHQYQR